MFEWPDKEDGFLGIGFRSCSWLGLKGCLDIDESMCLGVDVSGAWSTQRCKINILEIILSINRHV